MTLFFKHFGNNYTEISTSHQEEKILGQQTGARWENGVNEEIPLLESANCNFCWIYLHHSKFMNPHFGFLSVLVNGFNDSVVDLVFQVMFKNLSSFSRSFRICWPDLLNYKHTFLCCLIRKASLTRCNNNFDEKRSRKIVGAKIARLNCLTMCDHFRILLNWQDAILFRTISEILNYIIIVRHEVCYYNAAMITIVFYFTKTYRIFCKQLHKNYL